MCMSITSELRHSLVAQSLAAQSWGTTRLELLTRFRKIRHILEKQRFDDEQMQ